MKIIKWLKARRLRLAQEKHAMWKARREACERQLRHAAVRAAGNEAKYLERVEIFLREP